MVRAASGAPHGSMLSPHVFDKDSRRFIKAAVFACLDNAMPVSCLGNEEQIWYHAGELFQSVFLNAGQCEGFEGNDGGWKIFRYKANNRTCQRRLDNAMLENVEYSVLVYGVDHCGK
jgi:hypothetical protein